MKKRNQKLKTSAPNQAILAIHKEYKPPNASEGFQGGEDPYLPGCETGRAHEVSTGLNFHILVVFSADFTQLEGGAHLTV